MIRQGCKTAEPPVQRGHRHSRHSPEFLCSPPLLAQAATDLLAVTTVLPFPECPMNGIIEYVLLCASLLLNV